MSAPRFRHKLPAVVGIAGLTARQRQIVLLRCVDELTIPETAAQLGLTPSTVKNHATMIMRKTGHIAITGVCYELGTGQQTRFDALRPDEV